MQTEQDSQAWTVARLLAWTRTHFQRSGVESPRLCAELLLAHSMSCERIHLYTRHDTVPDQGVLAKFRGFVKEAAVGRPIAYLTGSKDFFSLPFAVNSDVLIPRPETEILVERAIELVRSAAKPPDAPAAILDLCTGSGCIAVSVAKNLPDARVVATDISQPALDVAQRNAQSHTVADRIEFRKGNLFDALDAGSKFDCIICNPPYIASSEAAGLPRNVHDFEPHIALFAGPDGLDVIRRVAAGAVDRLLPAGCLLMEIAFNQAAAVKELLTAGPWSQVITHRDGGGHERVVQARLAPG